MKIDAQKLRTLRTNAGMTQARLAEVSGISVRTVASMESGQRNPHRMIVEAVAQALGSHVDELRADGMSAVDWKARAERAEDVLQRVKFLAVSWENAGDGSAAGVSTGALYAQSARKLCAEQLRRILVP